MKIMIFLQGTILMHRSAIGVTRDERVRQVLAGEASTGDFAFYVPVGNAVRKLWGWKNQGAELGYLSSHRRHEDVETDTRLLSEYGFPNGPVLFRQTGEEYHDVAERALPDILIEDDCESIGGEKEMTYPLIKPEIKARIRSIIVPEFGGIDHLPEDVTELTKVNA